MKSQESIGFPLGAQFLSTETGRHSEGPHEIRLICAQTIPVSRRCFPEHSLSPFCRLAPLKAMHFHLVEMVSKQIVQRRKCKIFFFFLDAKSCLHVKTLNNCKHEKMFTLLHVTSTAYRNGEQLWRQ